MPDDEFAVGERRLMAENRPSSIIGCLIRPQEIADLAVFVCSGLAGAINGAALRVDGGIYRSVV
ncbi:SDR family oxidoreductase [Hymenobacter sp. YC55]|nr:SDR family oxidoreductase [Hymenobacter sp. YC55]MDF7811462.1 SDR family oxidoreductase [Hymenobacter sp. YC55]